MPFRAAIDAGVAAVMTGHLLVPAFDEANPATLSRRIVTDLLRGELGFHGLVFTDDLDMKAIAAGDDARARGGGAAIRAGCDVALSCGVDIGAHASAIEALVRAVEEEELPRARVEGRAGAPAPAPRSGSPRFQGHRSASAWRPMSGDGMQALVGCTAHQLVAEEMRRFA